ncbi:MAG: glycoside hydrolase family 26 protein [Bacteroidales bacterium]
MIARSTRFLYTFLALLAGISIVLLLSYLGGKSRGPLASLMDEAGTMVSKLDNNLIVSQRKDNRKSKLDWVQQYITEITQLKDPGVMLIGAYDNRTATSFESIISLEEAIKTTFPLIHIYTAWGDKPEEQYPRQQVQAITELGSIPVITWEPWLTDFSQDKHSHLPALEKRDKGGLADIARGKYDFYIREWAEAAKKAGQLIFVRLGHEMNDPYRYPWGPQNNTPKDFIAAWRHVHGIFTSLGVHNVLWIWSPHPSYGYFDAFYPGKDYVDYVGVNVLNYGTAVTWSKWWTFKEIFGTHYKELSKFEKPMMITEFGCLAVGGDRAKWFSEAMASLSIEYPAVKSILFFHFSDDRTTTQKSVDWTFNQDQAVLKAISTQIQSWPESLKSPSDRNPFLQKN